MSCDSGYYLEVTPGLYDTVRTACRKCPVSVFVEGCVRCSMTKCLECEPGFVLASDGLSCVKCDLNNFNGKYFLQPKRCSACFPTSPTACAYCDIGFMGSYSAPTECALTCDKGQYPKVTYKTINDNEN